MVKQLSRLFFTLCFILPLVASAQSAAVLNGKIFNIKNQALPGVSVNIKGITAGTSSNIDGNFSLKLSPGKYTLQFSTIGYQKKEMADVTISAERNEELFVVLDDSATKLQSVVVTSSSQRRESVNALIQYQKNTNTVAAVVSAEAIRRSPDRTTGEVLKRTPGTSLQEGRFIIVRGLADRYNQAMLNGILLSTTEPDRKSFSFDLIPSNMIDNIVINKAFVPELPGEWAGGLIQVNTKDIPSKGFFSVQIGSGFNTQTHGKDFYS
ncbi:MAG TPA: carboxypeptidase-like regulatory domain-containing protein, partial [Segetibacter sp.]